VPWRASLHRRPRRPDSPDGDNASRLLQALGAFGFPVAGLAPEAVADTHRMLEMGVFRVRIHVMSAISGVEWPEIWEGHVDGPFGTRTIPYIGRDTLIRNKRAAARPKDLSDLDALEQREDR
jgi:hypothetical protein